MHDFGSVYIPIFTTLEQKNSPFIKGVQSYSVLIITVDSSHRNILKIDYHS